MQLEIPREPIEQIAREVFEQMNPTRLAQVDEEAERMRATVARIMAKNLITINELRILLGECSHGYVDKLIEAAHKRTTDHPIPYCDLDGMIVFEPEKVMAWVRESKPLRVGKKKSGGRRKTKFPQAVTAQLDETGKSAN
jgi:hypothetical protein